MHSSVKDLAIKIVLCNLWFKYFNGPILTDGAHCNTSGSSMCQLSKLVVWGLDCKQGIIVRGLGVILAKLLLSR